MSTKSSAVMQFFGLLADLSQDARYLATSIYIGSNPREYFPEMVYALWLPDKNAWLIYHKIKSLEVSMPSVQLTNWKAIPNFCHPFTDIGDAVRCAVAEFQTKASTLFLILFSGRHTQYFLVPWTQYRQLPQDHPAYSSTIVFRGSYSELRQLAAAFPPDLFGSDSNHEPQSGQDTQGPPDHPPHGTTTPIPPDPPEVPDAGTKPEGNGAG